MTEVTLTNGKGWNGEEEAPEVRARGVVVWSEDGQWVLKGG